MLSLGQLAHAAVGEFYIYYLASFFMDQLPGALASFLIFFIGDSANADLLLDFGFLHWAWHQSYGPICLFVAFLPWLSACLKVVLVFLLIVLIRVTVPRLRLETLSRMG